MTTIPDLDKLRFSTNGGTTSEPPPGKKDTGHIALEEAASQHHNWLFNESFKRIKSLQGNEQHKIVGNATQKSQFTADLLISELIDANLEDGDKIVLLDGIHTLAAPMTLTKNKLEFICQSSAAELDIDGNTFTLNVDKLRGLLNVIDTAGGGSVLISGSDTEHMKFRISDPDIIDFSGSGSLVVNGDILSTQNTLLEISNQPDRVVLSGSEQALYGNDDRFVRHDQTEADVNNRFKRKDGTIVAIPTSSWVVIKSLDIPNNPALNGIVFFADHLKINTHHSFKLGLGHQGGPILTPFPVFIQGNDCDVDLVMDTSIEDLASIIGDEKDNVMTNGLSSMENRRVIKNQGRHNRIKYNRELIFSGGPPTAVMDFVRPNHPYLLEWDGFEYHGLLRLNAPFVDNRLECFFSDLYYWLDRRFNVVVPDPDDAEIHKTIIVPPRKRHLFRPINTADPNRHIRPADIDELDYIILAAEYTHVGDKIVFGGNPNAIHNIRNVKNGQRIQATGLPLPASNTTIVRPGSIITSPGSESFRIMNAENNAPISEPTYTASGNLTMNFSGMASGSREGAAFQNIVGNFLSLNTIPGADDLLQDATVQTGPFNVSESPPGTTNSTVQTSGLNVLRLITTFDTSIPAAGLQTANVTRDFTTQGIPHYKL